MPGSDPLTEAPELPVRPVFFRHAPTEDCYLRFVPCWESDPRGTLRVNCDARGRGVVEYHDDVFAALLDGRGPDGYELEPGSDHWRLWRVDGRKPTRDELRAMLAAHRERCAQSIRPSDVVQFWAAEAKRRRKARAT